MKIRILILFLAFAALLAAGPALSAGPEEVVEKLQQRYEKISAFSAGFTQEAYSKGMGKTQTFTGRVYFKKPGKMKWAYTGPSKDVLVSDGKMLWFYQSDLNQVVERPVEETSSALANDFLSGVGNIERDFRVSVVEEKDKVWRLELTPKRPQPNIRNLFIELDKSDYLVVRTVVQDLYGNETRVSFEDIKVNVPIDDSVFEFEVPEGATVIRP